jgi:hypothetical protein
MAKEESVMLIDLLSDVSKLPAYMQADAVKNIVEEWRRTNPLVDDVANGRTSFEAAISALVDENRSLTYFNEENACNSPQFTAMVKDAQRKFANILPLVSVEFNAQARAPVIRDLVSVADVRRMLWLSVPFFVGIGIAGGGMIWAMNSAMDGEFNSWWDKALIFGAAFGLFALALNFLFGHPMYIAGRRHLAEVTHRRAKFLDSMFKLGTA